MTTACSVRVRGVVQGVGFRPFVFRLARAHTLAGWVKNGDDGVEIHVEGPDPALRRFLRELRDQPPPAARIVEIDIRQDQLADLRDFRIRPSERRERPTARIAPDLPVCDDCLADLFDVTNARYGYPYINCTNCGPRYTIVVSLPYDRANTTMRSWPLDERCASDYHNPTDRRFHAQAVACPGCGPGFELIVGPGLVTGTWPAIQQTAQMLKDGAIVAVKGLGGYHLACDARHERAVEALRERKFRKEKPFALMASDLRAAAEIVELTPEAIALLTSPARPIVLLPARRILAGVAPETGELGVMLPYAPLHFLLFSAGAPTVLVMTSGNRSSEPIAYRDDDARERLEGLADAFLVGERPIARRVDDSIVSPSPGGPVILRRSRGYAPEAVAAIPSERPILAVGGDLKNSLTLVVDGQAFVSQHIGDLEQAECRVAFRQTIDDLLDMYDVDSRELRVACDAHPEYVSTLASLELAAGERCTVQHHRAHVASVLAEHGAWDTRVLGIVCDGTGYGDDRSIWGGELFVGSLRAEFERVAHLRAAALPGGDAAARYPVQAAAGLLFGMTDGVELAAPPFEFPARFRDASQLVRLGIRSFRTTSMGRLFDVAAALLGFTRAVSFEGQAAMWLEQRARAASSLHEAYPMPFDGRELDFRPLLQAVIQDRALGCDIGEVARLFHRGVATGLANAARLLCGRHELTTVVLSGGVFQNQLLLGDLSEQLAEASLTVLTNHRVPPNDGGLSLGQAALVATLPTKGGRS